MSDAPERIWSEHRTCTIDASGATRLLAMDRQFERGTEYIRADIHRAELEAVREACADKVWSVLTDYIDDTPRDGITVDGLFSDKLRAEQRAFVDGLRIARLKARNEILKEARK